MPCDQPIVAMAWNRCSSTIWPKRRMRARSIALAGLSGGSGKASSIYSLMTVVSVMTSPSCTSAGTWPSGLMARYSGVRCSPAGSVQEWLL